MNPSEQIRAIRAQLKESMTREISVMRELLHNLQQEQEAHLSNQIEQLRAVLRQRQEINGAFTECRQVRLDLMQAMADSAGRNVMVEGAMDEEKSMALVMEFAGSESCEIMLLRDQMLALLDQLKSLTNRNNYLIEHKLHQTKDLLKRLQPSNPNTTYGSSGAVSVKTATLPILNQEV